LGSKVFEDFPSASAAEYDSGRLYVFGDDAPYLMVLDTNYKRLDTIRYSIDTAYRMDRTVKSDVESATIIEHDGQKFLYAMGSLSNSHRTQLFYFPLSDVHTYLSISYAPFVSKFKKIAELNIEGMAFAKNKMVLANRANKTHKINQLILMPDLADSRDSTAEIIDLVLDSNKVIGVSGLYYVEELDKLFFTASEEDTPSATQDGTINDSYVGWISRFSIAMTEPSIKPDEVLKLTTIDKVFAKQKVESICLQGKEGGEWIFHLVADNDNGKSTFFKIALKP